jgi:Holin of 3TMs, for gene-transfer release
MWTILANLIGGPIVNGAIKAYQAKLEAGNTHDRIAADLAGQALALEKREAEVNAQVVIAEQGNWMTRSVRPALGWIVIVLVGKILLYDKAFGQWTGGHTDPLDANLWNVVMVIIGAYMGGRSAEKVATTIAGAFRK